MNKTSRKYLLPTVLVAASLLIGCQVPSLLSSEKPRVLVNVGSLKFEKDADLALVLRFQGNEQYSAQSLESHGVHKVQVTVTSPNLATPITQEITKEAFSQGLAVFNFTNLPSGPVNVKINAYNASGKLIQWASGDTSIIPGQTAVLTLYCNTVTGNLEVVYDCPDCPGTTPSPAPSSSPTPTPAPDATPSIVAINDQNATTARIYCTSLIIGNKAYIFGGGSGTLSGTGGGSLNYIDTAQIEADGSVGPLTAVASSSLAIDRRAHSTVRINDYVYHLGGLSNGGILNTVERAEIQSDFSLGASQLLNNITMSSPRFSFISAITKNESADRYLYAIGGANPNHDYPLTSIERAEIQQNGDISNFSTTSSTLVTPRVYASGNVIGNYMYVMGGFNGSAALDTVERAPISADGTIGSFTTFSNSTLKSPRYAHMSTVVGNKLFLVGGNYLGYALNTIEWAPIYPNGDIGEFNNLSGVSMNQARFDFASATKGNHIYLFLGRDQGYLYSTEHLTVN